MVSETAVFLGKFCLISVLSILVSCSGSSTIKTGGDIPSWILSPTPDSSESMYGIGEGQNLESARRAALKDVASKLRVSISGSMQSQLQVHNDQVDRQAVDRISEEIQKTEFSHFEVIKVASTTQGMAVLVQVDRQAFIRETEDKLTVLDKDIRSSTQALYDKTPLNQFLALRSVQSKLTSAVGYCQILTGARSGGSRDARLPRYMALIDQADHSAEKLIFEIRSKPEDKDLSSALAGLLHDAGAKVAPRVGASGVVLDINSTNRSNVIQGSNLVNIRVTLTTQDSEGRTVASKTHELTGASVTDLPSARLNALRKWSDQLKTTGLTGSLGLAK